MVEPEVLQQPQPLLYGPGVGGSSEGSEGVVVGNTFEQYLAPIEFHAEIRAEFHTAHSKALAYDIQFPAIGIEQSHLGGIEIRVIDVPEVGVGQNDGRQVVLAYGTGALLRGLLSHYAPSLVAYARAQA